MMSDEFPSTDYILANWVSTEDAKHKLKLSRQAIVKACRREPGHPQALRARLIADKWYIDPSSIEEYQKRYN